MRLSVRRTGRRTGRRHIAAPVLAAGAWTLVAGVHLFGVWVSNLWLFALLVYGLAYLVAVTLTVLAVVALWRLRGPAWAVPALVLGLLAPVAIVAVEWTSVFVHGFYRLNRGDFTAVATLARGGKLGTDTYYGDRLPPDLRYLSIDGQAAWIHSPDTTSPRAVFLPAWTGVPDGAVGYAYILDTPTNTTFDCFADPCRVHWSLGDGWYWLDRGGDSARSATVAALAVAWLRHAMHAFLSPEQYFERYRDRLPAQQRHAHGFLVDVDVATAACRCR